MSTIQYQNPNLQTIVIPLKFTYRKESDTERNDNDWYKN